jgi:YesN/AraC family two-component response regulator
MCSTLIFSKRPHNRIDLLLDYIHTNYDQPLSNDKIGKRFNFHPNYINKLMVLHTGTSLHQYLINFRLSKAANMLQSSSKSISEIAYSVGYKDINYFSKAFKNKYGESPSSFRSRLLGLI